MVKEREHLINLLGKTKTAAKREDVVELKKLSNQTIHTASIHHDSDNVLIAVFIYALSKVIEKGGKYYKENYQKYHE